MSILLAMHCVRVMIKEREYFSMVNSLLEIIQLVVEARSEHEMVTAVNHVDLVVSRGEVVGLIGESGSGKTTLVRSILDIHERNVRIASGRICFEGETLFDSELGISSLASLRGKRIGMIFQSPRLSLNPLMSVSSHLREVLRQHRPDLRRSAIEKRSRDVLGEMGLDPDRVLTAYPHQLSGGMCQRVAIAIAIATHPELLISDECTSALDVTTQEEVVTLLRSLTKSHNMALIFVTHDLLLASELCNRLVVMNEGNVIEQGDVRQVLEHPVEKYTRDLIASVPRWSASRASR